MATDILDAIEASNFHLAKHMIASKTLEICRHVEEHVLTPLEADAFFTLLDLYIDEHCERARTKLGALVFDILFEGMLLHDYGAEYGADLQLMRLHASKLLRLEKDFTSS
jgi:hypothetical protein